MTLWPPTCQLCEPCDIQISTHFWSKRQWLVAMALASSTGISLARNATRNLHCGLGRGRGSSAPSPTFPTVLKARCCRSRTFTPCALYVDDDDGEYLIDAPVSLGDGFSFTGGKYSDTPSPADQWRARGRIMNAYSVQGASVKAKDPLFGLAMGEASQTIDDAFRWFYVEDGERSQPSVLLTHGFPSQAYSYRKVVPLLARDYHVVALDWLGFGFSDKPQPKYGFNYTTDEYAKALKSVVEALELPKMTLVAQGYFAPAVVQFAAANPHMVERLILINPPLTDQHTKLPGPLSSFSGFLLGEIFAQDPLRASDKPLSECGPYILDEEDAMVYRIPYLTSGAAGFALTAISRAMEKELKSSVKSLRDTILSGELRKVTSVIWGRKDRWLDYKGVPDLTRSANVRLLELPEVGHHAQEDYGEEVARLLRLLLASKAF